MFDLSEVGALSDPEGGVADPSELRAGEFYRFQAILLSNTGIGAGPAIDEIRLDYSLPDGVADR